MTTTINASTSAGLVQTADTSGVLQLQTNGTAALTVDTSANVGIGTASPQQTLDVRGRIQVYNGTNGGQLGVDGGGLAISSIGAAPILFSSSTFATERMRINAGAPILCLAGGNTSATGTGIAFPATQSASSDVNTLDDYEEGTWTPVYVSTGATFSYTSTSQYGSYRKIGSLVIAQYYLLATATGTTTNSVQIQGLPFACVSGSFTHGSGFAWQGGAQALGFTVSPTSTNIDVWKQNGAGAVAATAANVTSTGAYVVGTIIYNAA